MTVVPFQQPAVTGVMLDRTAAGQQWLTMTFMYSFATQGGATSAITLTDLNGAAQSIPAKCLVIGGWINTTTGVTGGAGATAALGYTGSAAGLLAATLVSNAIFASPDTATATLITAATPLKTTAATSLTITPAVNALTAGVVKVEVLFKQVT